MDIRTTPDKKSAMWISVLSVIFAFGVAALIALFLFPVFGMGTLRWVALIVGEALIIVPALIYVRSRHYDLQKSFRLATPPSGTLPLAALIGISIQPIADELDKLFSQLFSMPEQVQEYLEKALDAFKIDNLGSLLLITLGAVIIAAITEEILFRGFLQSAYERDGSPFRAVLISSLVFAVVHFSPQFFQIFLLGSLLGYLALRTDSLYPGILLHMINNGIAITFININTENFSFYSIGNHVSPLILIPSILIFVASLKSFHTKTAARIIIKSSNLEAVS